MGSDELYRKLQQHLDHMPVGFPATESGVEIRILRQLFTPEDAAITLALSAIPESPHRVHGRLETAMPLPDLVAKLDAMAAKGIILKLGTGGEPRYAKMMWVVGIYERQIERLTPELARDALQYSSESFGPAFHTRKTTQMRVVPVNEAITPQLGVDTYENIKAYAAASEGPFAKMKCICRHAKGLLEEPCRQTKVAENCLTFGFAAKAMAERGDAQLISREEMIALLDEADKEGLVLQPENTKKPLYVCCCCGCCCGVLTTAKKLDSPADYFSSNYVAVLNAEACESCGLCRERCQMDAILDENGATRVDASRCIGCALCVTTCPSGALCLARKITKPRVPPENTRSLYLKLLEDRFGRLQTIGMVGRSLVGGKI
jgi:Na+-translocating ferredoxin:NAD+ oxidoreductase subunit B